MLLKKMNRHSFFINHVGLILGSAFALSAAQASAQTNAPEAQVSNDEDTTALTVLMRQMEDVVVTAPVVQTTVSKQEMKHEELNRHNTGQNLPYLLSVTPSVVTTSDDGLGIGYT